MNKLGKSALALLLSGVMAFSPSVETFAAEVGEQVAEETSAVDVEAGSEDVVEESVSEESSESAGAESQETEETVVAETETEETAVAETETTEETDESILETVLETEETGEYVFKGLSTDLTEEQIEDKKDLADHLDDFAKRKEGVDYVPGEVVFLADTQEEAEQVAAAYNGTLKSFDTGVGVVTLPEGVTVATAIEASADMYTVSATGERIALPAVWPNDYYTVLESDIETVEGTIVEGTTVEETAVEETTAEETSLDVDTEAVVPDEVYENEASYEVAVSSYADPFLSPTSSSYQWQHAMVGSIYAWNQGYTGKGVKVAVIDTGVASHADLSCVYGGSDSGTHGTHVAGLIGAKSNSVGGAGIAPGVTLYNFPALSGSSGTANQLLTAMNKAINEKVDIMNMSLGSYWYNGNAAKLATKAYNNGIAIFAAAGNECSNSLSYPAAYKNVYAVGAVQQDKSKAIFSNQGSVVKFSAPGVGLYSTVPGGYDSMSGTSQATPVVAGTAAVILSAQPSIYNKTGGARVNALISKMNSGKIAGKSGAAGIVSLPKALGLSTATQKPKTPQIVTKSQTVTGTSITVSIKAKNTTDQLYYSIDGKAVTFKKGEFSKNAIKAGKGSASITIKNDTTAKTVLKVIAINACGQISGTTTATYTFKPQVQSFTISGSNKLIVKGSTKLSIVTVPANAVDKAVKWESSNTSVATVDKSGKVVAKAKGSTVIKAINKKNNKSATFTVTVSDTATVKTVAFKNDKNKKVTSETVTRAGANVKVDLTKYLKVALTSGKDGGNANVTWSTSNKDVATVSAGVVTCTKAGKVKITAKANDGSNKAATITITVKQLATGCEINGTSKISQGKSYKFTANVLPADTTVKTVKWSIKEDTSDVKVDGTGKVTVKANAAAKTYTLVATLNTKEDQKQWKTVTKTFTVVSSVTKSITLKDASGNKVSKALIYRTSGNSNARTSITLTAVFDTTTGTATEYEFTNSNDSIAKMSVSGNKVTLTATGTTCGTTKVTCRAKDGSGKSTSATIQVCNPASKLTLVAPGGRSNYVARGKSMKLTPVFEEEYGKVSSKALTWTCSNSNFKVDQNGKVTAVVERSTAVITATAKDGSGVSASFKVVGSTPITSLTIPGIVNTRYVQTYIDLGDEAEVAVRYNGLTYATQLSNNRLFDPRMSISVADPSVLAVTLDYETVKIGSSYYSVPYVTLSGLKRGKTKFTLKSTDGTNVSVTYELMVK